MKKLIIIVPIIIILALLVYNYIYVNNYTFVLNGTDTIILNTNDTWEDPLYIVAGNKKIDIKDNVEYTKEGQYEINYTLKIGLFTKTLTRYVYILNDSNSTNFIFNLKGDNPYYLLINHEYEEDGYEAFDVNDGYITDNVIQTDNIDNTIEGQYEVKYEIKNSSGITKTLTRKIMVYSFNFDKEIKYKDLANENEITLKISDENYDYTVLPNNDKTYEKKINYRVTENGTYTFTMYDKKNNSFEYTANITNIDNTKPTGSCILTLTNNSGREITVTSSDNNKIKGYVYQYGDAKTEMMTDSKYTYKSSIKTASVIIYDTANNSNTINCTVIDRINKITPQPTTTNNNTNTVISYATRSYSTQQLNGVSYTLYSPSTTLKGKIPLVIYYHGAAGLSIGLPAQLASGANFPFYVACPVNNQDPNFAANLISNLSSRLGVDTSRIYISGASSGTKPAINIAYQLQGRFAGAIILASYSGTPNLNVGVPMWFFQGTNDSYQMVVNIVNNINASGGKAQLTSYSGGHDAPLGAFQRSDLTSWILKK